MKQKLYTLAILFLCGCVPALNPEARQVEVVLNPIVAIEGEKVGEVIGSAGKWYNSIFISNPALINGALNDLRNNAYLMGSDRVYVYRHIDFTSSVTFLGEAYSTPLSPKKAGE